MAVYVGGRAHRLREGENLTNRARLIKDETENR
jgi:hypothetical protein